MPYQIYIPLCIYFNKTHCDNKKNGNAIYIPLCIYFNLTRHQIYQAIVNLHSTMYLFQRHIIRKAVGCEVIYIPLCIYFNETETIIETVSIVIYIPLCIYFNKYGLIAQPCTLSFTFHYVSISTAFNIVAFLCHNSFTFHYVSISTFQQELTATVLRFIYIPLCIYFNNNYQNILFAYAEIYIPLCIYFNREIIC